MKKLILASIVLFCLTMENYAQDVHFSQFFNMPTLFNPAMTGNINGSFRVGAIYRNQWPGPINGRTAYSTPAVAVDAPIRFKKDILGVGAYFVNDRSAGAKLKRFNFMASAAYHKAIGTKHSLSLGVQAGYLQYSLEDLKYADQYDELNNYVGGGADLGTSGKASNFDFNLGIAWNALLSSKLRLTVGAAAFHLLAPKITFSDQSTSGNVPRRFNTNLNLDWQLTNKVALSPSYLYMHQAKASQHNFGLSTAIKFKDNTDFFVGAFYRVKDAVIPYVGVQFLRFKLGLSYDVNASSLNKTNGATEISLSYTGPYKPVPEVNPALYCPRF